MATVISDVRATVEALAKGLVPESKMPAPDPKTKKTTIRCAPSFVAGASCNPGLHHPYTATTVAQFLGRTNDATPVTKEDKQRKQPALAITVALDALELIEQGALTEDAAIDQTTHEELGPKALAQKIQAKREAIEAAARAFLR